MAVNEAQHQRINLLKNEIWVFFFAILLCFAIMPLPKFLNVNLVDDNIVPLGWTHLLVHAKVGGDFEGRHLGRCHRDSHTGP